MPPLIDASRLLAACEERACLDGRRWAHFPAGRLGVKNAVRSSRGSSVTTWWFSSGAVTGELNPREHESDKRSGRWARVQNRFCHPG